MAQEVLNLDVMSRWMVHSSDVLWRINNSGSTDYVTDNVYDLIGYTSAHMMAAGPEFWMARVHPQDMARVRDNYKTIMTAGTAFDIEYRIQHRDGRWIWVQTKSLNSFTADGLGYIDGIVTNITPRKEAEELLKLRTQQLQSITHAMTSFLNDGDWGRASADLLRGALSLTDSCLGWAVCVMGAGMKILGVATRGESSPLGVGNVQRADNDAPYEPPAQVRDLIMEALSSDCLLVNDPVAPRGLNGRAGVHDHLDNFLAVPVERQGSMVGLIAVANRRGGYGPSEVESLRTLSQAAGVMYDSYERRQSQAQLQERLAESEERYRRRVENSYDLLFEADASGECLYVSPSYRDIMGYEPEELVGKSLFILVHPEDVAKAAKAFETVIVKGRVSGQEVRLRHKSGQYRLMETTGRAWTGSDGMRRGVGICRDITERRAAEELARRQQSQLAHLSRITTMGELASGLAHELNQPLGAILNYAATCLDVTDQAEPRVSVLRDALGQVVRETNRAGDIIRRLRAFVQKQGPQAAPVSLEHVLNEALSLLGAEIRQHDVRCDVFVEPGLPLVLADNVQIEQVLVNLLQNAVDATEGLPAERKRIIIRVGRAICAHAQVFIRDGGCGVAPADMPKLFDAFYTTKPKGLGIGLSISRSIIESHRGHLRASANSDGPGMTFEFTIPLVQETPV